MTFNGVVRLNCAAGNGRPFAVRCLEIGNATLQLQRSQRLNWGIDGNQNGLLIVQQHARRRPAGLRHHSRDPDGYAFPHNQLGCVHAHSRAEDPRLTIEGKLRSGCVGLGSWPDVDTIDEHGRESIRTPVPSLTPKTKDARDVMGPRRKGLAASVVGWHPAHIAMNTAPMHTRKIEVPNVESGLARRSRAAAFSFHYSTHRFRSNRSAVSYNSSLCENTVLSTPKLLIYNAATAARVAFFTQAHSSSDGGEYGPANS